MRRRDCAWSSDKFLSISAGTASESTARSARAATASTVSPLVNGFELELIRSMSSWPWAQLIAVSPSAMRNKAVRSSRWDVTMSRATANNPEALSVPKAGAGVVVTITTSSVVRGRGAQGLPVSSSIRRRLSACRRASAAVAAAVSASSAKRGRPRGGRASPGVAKAARFEFVARTAAVSRAALTDRNVWKRRCSIVAALNSGENGLSAARASALARASVSRVASTAAVATLLSDDSTPARPASPPSRKSLNSSGPTVPPPSRSSASASQSMSSFDTPPSPSFAMPKSSRANLRNWSASRPPPSSSRAVKRLSRVALVFAAAAAKRSWSRSAVAASMGLRFRFGFTVTTPLTSGAVRWTALRALRWGLWTAPPPASAVRATRDWIASRRRCRAFVGSSSRGSECSMSFLMRAPGRVAATRRSCFATIQS